MDLSPCFKTSQAGYISKRSDWQHILHGKLVVVKLDLEVEVSKRPQRLHVQHVLCDDHQQIDRQYQERYQ